VTYEALAAPRWRWPPRLFGLASRPRAAVFNVRLHPATRRAGTLSLFPPACPSRSLCSPRRGFCPCPFPLATLAPLRSLHLARPVLRLCLLHSPCASPVAARVAACLLSSTRHSYPTALIARVQQHRSFRAERRPTALSFDVQRAAARCRPAPSSLLHSYTSCSSHPTARISGTPLCHTSAPNGAGSTLVLCFRT
jgi:hypothetical protein